MEKQRGFPESGRAKRTGTIRVDVECVKTGRRKQEENLRESVTKPWAGCRRVGCLCELAPGLGGWRMAEGRSQVR